MKHNPTDTSLPCWEDLSPEIQKWVRELPYARLVLDPTWKFTRAIYDDEACDDISTWKGKVLCTWCPPSPERHWEHGCPRAQERREYVRLILATIRDASRWALTLNPQLNYFLARLKQVLGRFVNISEYHVVGDPDGMTKLGSGEMKLMGCREIGKYDALEPRSGGLGHSRGKQETYYYTLAPQADCDLDLEDIDDVPTWWYTSKPRTYVDPELRLFCWQLLTDLHLVRGEGWKTERPPLYAAKVFERVRTPASRSRFPKYLTDLDYLAVFLHFDGYTDGLIDEIRTDLAEHASETAWCFANRRKRNTIAIDLARRIEQCYGFRKSGETLLEMLRGMSLRRM